MGQTTFYSVPAWRLVAGVSTADGQDVLSVRRNGSTVSATVYTPRPDDSAVDEENRATPETRIYDRQEMVSLAVFDDTAVSLDGK